MHRPAGHHEVDPITTEVLRNAFNAIAEEMNANLVRSAYTPIIYVMKDCSVGLFNEHAELLGQAAGLPIFLGALDAAVKVVRAKVGLEDFQPGDVYLINDSYLTGSHLGDVTVLSPIFYRNQVIGFAATKAHWLDIGGKDVRVSTDTTEIYQEGIRLGPTRVMAGGEMMADIIDILIRNSRLPKAIIGTLNPQIVACRTGERRYTEIIERFGLETVRAATSQIFAQAERADREVIASIPDGEYTDEGYLDSDGHTQEPVYVRVKVTVRDSDLEIDLTGSSQQRPGCTNCGFPMTVSAARLMYKFLVNPHQTPNGGHFRALAVIVPRGTVFSAQEPAACQFYAPALALMIELGLKAISQALPGRVPAGQPADQMNFMMAGQTRDGEVFTTGEASAVGWGALPYADGANATVNSLAGDLLNLPAEIEEAKYPLLVTRRALEIDSGGAGRYRGGLALIKEYVPLVPGCRLVLWLERTVTPAWGVYGGRPGKTARCLIDPDGTNPTIVKKVNHLPIQSGMPVRCHTAGGGGYGPPWERPISEVLQDVFDGYVSAGFAESDYGLRFRPGGSEVDEAKTRSARAEMSRGARWKLEATATESLELPRCCRSEDDLGVHSEAGPSLM
jgi:N-methylhydantoinase B